MCLSRASSCSAVLFLEVFAFLLSFKSLPKLERSLSIMKHALRFYNGNRNPFCSYEQRQAKTSQNSLIIALFVSLIYSQTLKSLRYICLSSILTSVKKSFFVLFCFGYDKYEIRNISLYLIN